MAQRPVYVPCVKTERVKIFSVDFEWHSGFAVSQKQKSITSLHAEAMQKTGCKSLLDISSKSPNELGVSLSAFNLKTKSQEKNIEFSVETAFQSSKIFENGGPYLDLLTKSSKEAKKDPRIRNSGKLIGFEFFKKNFPLTPKTFFYDWLYINTLLKNSELTESLLEHDGFTDIEFNPQKSINCQAFSVAVFCLLKRLNKISGKTLEMDDYRTLTNMVYRSTKTVAKEQLTLT